MIIHSKRVTIAWQLLLLVMITPTSFSQKIIRGPYLQMSTPTSMMIRWRTDIPVASKINFGLIQNALNSSKSEELQKTEHIITIDNLKPNTKYFYGIASGSTIFQASIDNFFVTNPPVGTEQKVTIWALGDMGMGTEGQKRVYQQYLNYTKKTHTNLWLLLGDNAYAQGMDW